MMLQVVRTEKISTEESHVFKLNPYGQFVHQSKVDTPNEDITETSYKVYDAELDAYRSLTPLEEALISHAEFENVHFFHKPRVAPIDEGNPF